jgi:hypothetical protein
VDVPDYEEFFREYAKVYERSLGESVDVAAIRSFFAEAFVAASVSGHVAVGANNETFEQTLRSGYSFYKAIGTTSMKIDRVESEVSVPFDVMYLLQRRSGGPKIFGFVAGDEMAIYRTQGLVDETGQPA